jgi:hypothetical protein
MKFILGFCLSLIVFVNLAAAECTPTPKYYCNEAGLLTACPAGFYCPGVNTTEKIACPEGTYTNGIGSATCNKCFAAMPDNTEHIVWNKGDQTSRKMACSFASMTCAKGFHYAPLVARCEFDCVASEGFYCSDKNASPSRCPSTGTCPGKK